MSRTKSFALRLAGPAAFAPAWRPRSAGTELSQLTGPVAVLSHRGRHPVE